MLRRVAAKTCVAPSAICVVLWGGAAAAAFQDPPLQRSFTSGETRAFQVELVLRSELAGHRSYESNGKTYAEPFLNSAEVRLAWHSTLRVREVRPDGSAEIEEALDAFTPVTETHSGAGAEVESLLLALRDAAASWSAKGPHTLRYPLSRAGQPAGFTALALLKLEENPRVLTLWLARALRPAATLPERPFRLGDRWQEPRHVELDGWSDIRGAETGEWLPARDAAEPAARLHIVQQISAAVAPSRTGIPACPALQPGHSAPSSQSSANTSCNARARFHAESLATLALADGSLLAASRTATREITWDLAPVAGLPEPPRFRGRLTAQVEIRSIP